MLHSVSLGHNHPFEKCQPATVNAISLPIHIAPCYLPSKALLMGSSVLVGRQVLSSSVLFVGS